MPTAVQQPSLENLPLAWLSQLATCLPAHQRLKLRQCSRQMQQIVDSTGVHLHLSSMLSLSLAAQQLACLDVTEAAALHEHCESELQRAGLRCAETGSLASLTHLVCGSTQPQLLAAFARCSPRLARLTLNFKGALTIQDENEWTLLPTKAPGLVSSLYCLEMDYKCHKQFLGQQCLQQVVGTCTNLKSLAMRMPKAKHCTVLGHKLSEHVWQKAIQPLTSLTRLEMGMRVANEEPARRHYRDVDLAGEEAGQPAYMQGADQPGCLPLLQHLRCFGFDGPFQDSWNLTWVGQHTALTCLDLMMVSSGEVDFDVIAQLQQLCTLSLHCAPDELFTSSQLAPLSRCTQLTFLRLDSLVIEPGHTAVETTISVVLPIDTAGREVVGGGQLAQDLASEDTMTPGPAGQSILVPAADALLLVMPQLRSLKKLVAGLLCQAPVSTLAPSLVQLRDLDYDLHALELGSSFVNEHPPAGQEPLAGLDSLQLLSVNILALVRHAASSSLTLLSNLNELHLDMVGNLDGTSIGAPVGLPRLPHLTKLVMKLETQSSRKLLETYSTEEDMLLWQNQQSVRHLRVRGSKLLGGFLVHDHLLAMLPSRMPDLQLIELVKCPDLTVADLAKLVNSCAALHIMVQCCTQVCERDCVALQQSVGNSVVVAYSTGRERMLSPDPSALSR